jgi:Helix-turn-helix domain
MCWILKKAALALRKHLKPAIDFSVLDYLTDRADKDCRLTWPGLPTIARECGCCKNTARAAVERLEERGLISVLRFNSRSSMYLVFPDNQNIDKSGPVLATDVSRHLRTKWHGCSKDVQTVIEWLVEIGKIVPADGVSELVPSIAIKSSGAPDTNKQSGSNYGDHTPSNNCTRPLQNLDGPPPTFGPDSNKEPNSVNPDASLENAQASFSPSTTDRAGHSELEEALARIDSALSSMTKPDGTNT